MKKRRKENRKRYVNTLPIFFLMSRPLSVFWEKKFFNTEPKHRARGPKEGQQISVWDWGANILLILVYNKPMQIELFRYLFPLCLAQWT